MVIEPSILEERGFILEPHVRDIIPYYVQKGYRYLVFAQPIGTVRENELTLRALGQFRLDDYMFVKSSSTVDRLVKRLEGIRSEEHLNYSIVVMDLRRGRTYTY